MDTFGAYARFYDLLYRGKDYATEAAYVDRLIRHHAPTAATVLDLGCGTGRHATEMVRLGYDVCGVDISATMLAAANHRRAVLEVACQDKLRFVQGDARSYRAERKFDVVTALFHVLSYQVSNHDLAQAFATATVHLAPGGLFIFDFWYGPGVLSDPPSVRVRRMRDADTDIVRIAEPVTRPNENLVEVHYEVILSDRLTGAQHTINERHDMRYLFRPELDLLLEKYSLTPLKFLKWTETEEPDLNTWNAVIIARANPGHADQESNI